MSATPSGTSESVASQATKLTRGHSCVLCQQRKVKCDKQKPSCSNCLKARVECVPSAPSLPRRRRRKLTETDLVGRLRKYEHLLKTHGVKVEEDEPASGQSNAQFGDYHDLNSREVTMSAPRARNAERGALFTDKENSHYVENTLWENLRDEIADPKDSLQGSSDDELNETGLFPIPESFLMGFGSTSRDLSNLHPPPVQIFRLWQTFLVNVNPLIKMFHAPTLQQTILDASGDLQNVPRHIEALMFSIYFISVVSLQNEDCQTLFGEQRNILLAKYSHGAQQALIGARFLKSLNLNTLQALVLYLLAIRNSYDPHSLWILSGAAVRIAQRLGLHRDGSNHDIPPFDAEIRRRTWWQVVFIDGHSSKLSGAGFPAWLAKFDTQIPKNISDSDLSPTMKEPPVDKKGATEMMFCCLRYETAQALRTSKIIARGDGSWDIKSGSSAELLAEKDRAIDALEIKFQQQFVQYCDNSIPLHLLVTYVAKSIICTMRIMAHHPRQYPDKGATMPQREKDMLFAESLKEMEFDSIGHTTQAIRGYVWHITSHFQLDAFIYLLSELRYRTSGDLVERAWNQIKVSFENRPEIITDRKNSLYVAIGNLALKAWQKREEALGSYQVPPRYISLLRSQRNIPDPPQPTNLVQNHDPYARARMMDHSDNAQPQNTNFSNTEQQWADWGNTQQNDIDMGMTMPEITSVDWEYWQTLMDGDLPAFSVHTGDTTAGSQWWA